ncbi:MAG: PorT family protein [Bacteroidales bacterium]|nr:PorT family protein [Bacteroidales bacterium]
MRKIVLAMMLLLFGFGAFGQKSKPMNLTTFDYMKAHLGYSVGINWMTFTTVPNEGMMLTVKQHPGININLVTSIRLAKYLDLRILPGIQFGQRDLYITDSTSLEEWDAPIESVFVDFPILLKYSSKRINNYAPYLIAGINPRFDLTGGEIYDWQPAQRLVKVFDIYPEIGVGVDFYLANVKMATELKFSIGMRDIFYPPPDEAEYDLFGRAIDKILSRMVIFSIHIG